MWQGFVIRNFRGIAGLALGPLDRVNIIAGKNNTGKTAVLEALHLHSYPQDCHLPFTISEERGGASPVPFSEAEGSWLFHTQQRGRAAGAEFESTSDQGNTRELLMAMGDAAMIRHLVPATDAFVQGSFLEADWKNDGPRIVLFTRVPGQLPMCAVSVPSGVSLRSLGLAKAPWDGASFFMSAWRHDPEADLKTFNDLLNAKREEEILQSLRLLEPRLKRLTIGLLDNRPEIHADIGLAQLVPGRFMGEGFRRVLAILSAIAVAVGGRVLIDEIENGLHHSVMKEVWKAIAHAARANNVQVFATTHSWECIRFAHESFSESNVYDMRMHRLDRIDAEINAVTYDSGMIEAALYTGLEMR